MIAPLISCIVPVFNAERYVAEALESVLGQSYRPIEIIVVDDGSTDGSAQVVARFGDAIRYFYQENRGHAGARNRGIEEARGDLIAFLDADDRWHPDKLACQASILVDHPAVDLCYGKTQNFWDDDIAHEASMLAGHQLSAPAAVLLPNTALVRRRVFEQFGHFDIDLDVLNDHQWAMRCVDNGASICAVGNVLHERRIHRSNMSRVKAERQREEMTLLLKSALDRRRKAAAPWTPS